MVTGTTLLTNAFLVDCAGNEPREQASVVVEGERISEVRFGESGPRGRHDAILDCAGMTLMPGLTDAHVHIGAVDVNILARIIHEGLRMLLKGCAIRSSRKVFESFWSS